MKNPHIKTLFASLALTLASSVFSLAIADIAVIAHKDSPLSNITAKQGKRIFLSMDQKLPDGQTIKVLNQRGDSKLNDQFYKKIANKTPAEVSQRWNSMIFANTAKPRKIVASDQEAIDFVSKNTGAIAYVDTKSIKSSKGVEKIKVILTLE